MNKADWMRAYDEALQWRDWQTCEILIAERKTAPWYFGGMTEREGAGLLTQGSADKADAGSIPAPSVPFQASRRFWPRTTRANRSRVFHTQNWHLYLWRGKPCSNGLQSGVTVKHRRRDGMWRHVQLRRMHYQSSENGYGAVTHFELCWHLSSGVRSSISRVKGSKRYLRFKVCL